MNEMSVAIDITDRIKLDNRNNMFIMDGSSSSR